MFLNYFLNILRVHIFVIISLFIILNKSYSDSSNIWEKANLSVVSVLPTWPGYEKPGFGAPFGTAPEGSGIVLNTKGIILTASHVISRAVNVSVRDINGNIFDAEIIFDNPETDISLLKTKEMEHAITINDETLKIGSKACILSNSFGLDINITCGIISGKNLSGIGFNEIEDFIQTDAAANPGSSGGALVNKNGEMIGMISAIFTKETDTNVGVNFAISSRLIKSILKEIDY